MVVLSLEQYAALTDEIELKLDEADKAVAADSTHYTEDEVFNRVRERIYEGIQRKKKFFGTAFLYTDT